MAAQERTVALHDFGTIKVLEFENPELARAVANAILYGSSYGARFVAISSTDATKEALLAKIAEVKDQGRVVTNCGDCRQELVVPRRDPAICDACHEFRHGTVPNP